LETEAFQLTNDAVLSANSRRSIYRTRQRYAIRETAPILYRPGLRACPPCHSTSRKHATWLALVSTIINALASSPSAQRLPEKFDRHVNAQILSASDDEPVRVIVTIRRGARQRLTGRLQALGVAVDQDLRIIDGVAGRMPPRVLRALALDPDVVAVSHDAEVTADGLESAIAELPLGAAYTLRRTLGLDSSVAVDATSYAHAKTASLSWSHTVGAGNNRLLVVRTAHRDGNKTVSGVTYGGLALTKLADQNAPGNQNKATLWYMLNPPVGGASVVVTLSGTVEASAAATSFTGVSQSTPLGGFTSSSGQSPTPQLALSGMDGDVVLDVVSANGDAKSMAAGPPQTVQWNKGTGTDGGAILGGGSTARGASAVSLSWTLGDSKPWSMIAALVKPASGPVPAATGSGVTVAVLDSGLLQDGGGTARIKTTRDFTTGNANPPAIAPIDPFGHGTHVAGLIGDQQNEDDVRGVAPGVQYVSLRVLDGLGVGSTSNVINAIQWAVANKAVYGIDVINLSLGHPILEAAATDPLVQAVEAAIDAGIVAVVSAGNVGILPATGLPGYGGITSPGNAPSAISVGAERTADTTTRADDLVADYSSRGPTWYDAYDKPDIVAPGHRLLGPADSTQYLYQTYPLERGRSYGTRNYLRLSGTSMAAGVVSGSVALMIENTRAAFGVTPAPSLIKAMLEKSAFSLTDASGTVYDALTQGAGALNPVGALALAQAINPAMPAGSSWLVTGLVESSAIDGQHIVWGDHIVWATTSCGVT
jgi:hypothetical protein